MDHYRSIIEIKMLKVESTLKDINNEISTVFEHVSELKEYCNTVVKNLGKITNPATYLQEFVNVNSFLLKFLSFLSEINCKFEVLDISEKLGSSCISNNELTSSFIIPGAKNLSEKENHSAGELNFNPPKKNLKYIPVKQPLTGSQKPKKNIKKSKQNESNIKFKKTTLVKTNVCSQSQELLSSAVDFPEKQDKMMKKKHNTATKQSSKSQSINISDSEINYSVNSRISDSLCSGSISGSEFSQTKDWQDSLDTTPIIEAFDTIGMEDTCEKECQAQKNENANELEDIKPFLVSDIDKDYDITIENIKSPSEFYIFFNDNSNMLIELEEKLKLIPISKNKFCETNNQDKKALLKKEIDNYCLVYSKCDEIWCRGKIINWNLNYNDDFISVFLLDYGEFKCISIHDIQALPEFLRKYPALTVRCHLHNIVPVDMNKDSEALTWGKDCTEAMRSLTENSNKIRLRIASNDDLNFSSSLPVALLLVDQDKWIHDLLVEKNYATLVSQLHKSAVGSVSCNDIDKDENLSNWNPMKEDFESYQNCYNVDINDPGTIIYGYVGKDYDRICTHYANTGYCFKGKACRKEHSKLDPLGYTTDEEEIYKNAFNNLPIPSPKSVFNVHVTCVLNFNEFFCFSEDFDKSSMEETLQSLVKFMNKPENIKEMNKLGIPPSVGQIVIACYSADGAWYRARILESEPENDSYKVLFVDYGNKETLTLSDIRAMEARYLHLPFQAVQCFIFGIEQNPNKPVKETIDFLADTLNNGELRIEVVETLPGDQVHLLVNAFDQEGKNIADVLIANEYAFQKKEEIIISSASESIPG